MQTVLQLYRKLEFTNANIYIYTIDNKLSADGSNLY